MMPYDKSEPAFPIEDLGYKGMTLRDYFAGQALSGLFADQSTQKWTPDVMARSAYEFADAMLKARDERVSAP